MGATNAERMLAYRERLKAAGLERNRGPKKRGLYLRLDDDVAEVLTQFARSIGSSRPEAVRVILEEGLEEWRSR